MSRKSSKHCTRHTKPLESCFDFIRSHQQCIPRSPPLEIEPATTVFAGFSGHGNTIHNTLYIYLVKSISFCERFQRNISKFQEMFLYFEGVTL